MRKTKRIKMDDMEITVYELRVKDIRGLMDRASGENLSLENLGDFLPVVCDLPPGKFPDLAPSEIQQIWEAFHEVNAVFFGWTAKAGIGEMIAKQIRTSWIESFADSSKKATPA